MKNDSLIPFRLNSIFSLVLLLLFIFGSCENKTRKNEATENTDGGHKFVMVSIPDDISLPIDRANYLASHYWDNFDFSDTTYIHLPNQMEQAFVDYIEVLPHADKKIAYESEISMLKKAEQEKSGRMYTYVISLLKKYLYDPNSPLRNEEYYIPVVDYIINDKKSSEVDKERMKFDREMMDKNRIGTTASDITYTLASGKTGKLSDINSPYTLLMFYNPDCHACEEIISYIKFSPVINKAQEERILSVFTFYPDKDLQIWKKHLPDIPVSWINGYDKNQTIENKKVYDLKAIPTLYLLDKDKKVLLKDADIHIIEQYLLDRNQLILSQ